MNEILLVQYESDIELYKFYVNFVLKINAFHYAMSAAIFSYLLSHKLEQYLEYIIFFPIIFSGAIVVICVKGYPRVKDLHKGVALKVKLLKLPVCPVFTTLKVLIGASVIMHILIIICSLFFMCWFPKLSTVATMPPK